MAEVRNCKRCNCVFQSFGSALCQTCLEADEQNFKKIKEYLYTHPGATLSEVATVLNISVPKIKRFLREGRLEIIGSNSKNLILDCEICGRSINTGHYCMACENKLKHGLNAVSNSKNTIKKINVNYRYYTKNN